MKTIGDAVCKNFNRLMDGSGKSKREVARLAGVSEATLQRWKSGISHPEINNIEKLAEVFGVDPVEFYLKEVPPLPIESFQTRALLQEITRRMADIPEDICDMAEKLGIDNEVWDEARLLLNDALERMESERRSAQG